MIKLDLLDALSDNELDQIEAYSQALKQRRDEERKSKAMEQAKAILAAAGIDMELLHARGKGRTAKSGKKRGKRPVEAV
jgi:hypothetical protein